MSTTSELQKAKQVVEIRSIERRARLGAISDYLGFAVSKLSGFGLTGVGIYEMVSPNTLHLALSHPSAVAGAGIAILGGPQIAKILTKALIAFQ